MTTETKAAPSRNHNDEQLNDLQRRLGEQVPEEDSVSNTQELGALIRARREGLGASLRATARAVRRSPAWLSKVETGHDTPGEEALERLALRLECDREEQERWCALAGIIPRTLRDEMLAHPERWSAVRVVLKGRRP